MVLLIQECAAKLICVIFTGKLGFEDHVDFVMIDCSQRVETVANSGPSNTAVTCGLCDLDIVPYYLRTPSLGRAPHQTATRMPGCCFATQIIPRPNYLTRQMLGFLALYKDQT